MLALEYDPELERQAWIQRERFAMVKNFLRTNYFLGENFYDDRRNAPRTSTAA